VIEDGFSGLLTSNDEQSVADTLARLPDYPELGAHGRARVTTRFTVDAMVNGTLAVYRQVLAPPPSSSS
jgi:glycosyltransferase involved in cell wall biosynthesis